MITVTVLVTMITCSRENGCALILRITSTARKQLCIRAVCTACRQYLTVFTGINLGVSFNSFTLHDHVESLSTCTLVKADVGISDALILSKLHGYTLNATLKIGFNVFLNLESCNIVADIRGIGSVKVDIITACILVKVDIIYKCVFNVCCSDGDFSAGGRILTLEYKNVG